MVRNVTLGTLTTEQHLDALIDTGATHCIVPPSTARVLRFDSGNLIGRERVNTVGGQVVLESGFGEGVSCEIRGVQDCPENQIRHSRYLVYWAVQDYLRLRRGSRAVPYQKCLILYSLGVRQRFVASPGECQPHNGTLHRPQACASSVMDSRFRGNDERGIENLELVQHLEPFPNSQFQLPNSSVSGSRVRGRVVPL